MTTYVDDLARDFHYACRSLSHHRRFSLVASYAVTRVLASQISEVSTTDFLTFAGVVVIVGTASLAACSFPAMRAAQADPFEALRHE